MKKIKNNTCSRTWATFIIYGETLDPEIVSALLNLEPNDSFMKGELFGSSNNLKVRRNGHWDIETKEKINSVDISEHIEWILNKIEFKKERIIDILSKYPDSKAYIFCFWELKEKDAHGGPILKPELLKRIANLNLELSIDFYS